MPDTPFPPSQMDASGPPQQLAFPSYPYGPPASSPGLPPFPTWPPPSGGAPVTKPELGPVTNPTPYGSTQTGNIPSVTPWPPLAASKGTFYPQRMPTGANGQNQGPGYGLPVMTKPWEVGPLLAPTSISAISPAPIMGPGAVGVPPN
jgi:hypothetical protein